jgi:hypothetical protein
VTDRFAQTFCGRVLGNPSTLFDEELLRPEKQDAAVFAEGMDNICIAMRAAAACYFADGSVAQAVPPLRALLHLMHDGTWEGRGANDATFRALFTRAHLLASDWYRARLAAQQRRDRHFWETQLRYLEKFLARANYSDVAALLDIKRRRDHAHIAVTAARQEDYLGQLTGTLGLDPALAPTGA